MKRIAKKISCIALTAALVTGSLPGDVLAAKIQTEMPVTEQMEQVQTDQTQPEEGDDFLPENESAMTEGTVEVQPEEEVKPDSEGTEKKCGSPGNGRSDCGRTNRRRNRGKSRTVSAAGRF